MAESTNGAPLIRLEGVSKVFYADEVEIHALSSANLEIRHGEYIEVAAPSGRGKSTLLSILGLLDTPTEGVCQLNGESVEYLNARQPARIRNRQIGFILKAFNLIGDVTACGNVELPMTYRGMPASVRNEGPQEVLERLEMAHRKNHYASQLSSRPAAVSRGGEGPWGCPFGAAGDKPTGNLDFKNGGAVMELLQAVHLGGLRSAWCPIPSVRSSCRAGGSPV